MDRNEIGTLAERLGIDGTDCCRRPNYLRIVFPRIQLNIILKYRSTADIIVGESVRIVLMNPCLAKHHGPISTKFTCHNRKAAVSGEIPPGRGFLRGPLVRLATSGAIEFNSQLSHVVLPAAVPHDCGAKGGPAGLGMMSI